MPRRRKRGASLGIKAKGYWKVWKKAKSDNENSNTEQSEKVVGFKKNTIVVIEKNVEEKMASNNVTTTTNDASSASAASDDTNILPADERAQKKNFHKLKINARRWTVFDLFVHKYEGLEPPPSGNYMNLWSGRNGIASKIRRDVGLSPNSGFKMIPIFERILECHRTEQNFDPKLVDKRGGNNPCVISLDSPEAQIIADGMESGLSIKKTWYNVNWHRKEADKEMVSEYSIYSAIRRMKPKLNKIQKRKQGSSDPDSTWSRARFEWATQLLVRFGKLKPQDFPQPLERRFDRDSIGHLHLHQVVWWDETHRKCLIGGLSATKDVYLSFPRDSNGKLKVKGGKYSDKKVSRLNVKYEKECRMGLGCAVVAPLDPDGRDLPVEGRRANLFDYSGKVLISLADFEKMKGIEFARVRKSGPTKWVTRTSNPELVYASECVKRLSKCGEATRKKLEKVGIKIVRDLQNVPDPNTFSLPQGLSKKTFEVIWQKAQEASTEDLPPPIDHRKALNPYESKFGEGWLSYLKKSPTFSSSIVITDYMEHIMSESQKIMHNTKYQDDWVVYHDALTLMTAKENKDWLLAKGYLKRWILPSNDLYVNSPDLYKKYGGNPIGNSPEFMPWDAHLNNDIHSSMDYHCLLSKGLDDDDTRKFDFSTPKKMLHGYKRLMMPDGTGVTPKSSRIVEDATRVLKALEHVREAKGIMIEEKKLRTGRRRDVSNKKHENWGGSREKSPQSKYLPPEEDLHQDLMEVVKDLNGRSVMASVGDASTVTLGSAFVEIMDDDNMASENIDPKNNESEILAVAKIVEI